MALPLTHPSLRCRMTAFPPRPAMACVRFAQRHPRQHSSVTPVGTRSTILYCQPQTAEIHVCGILASVQRLRMASELAISSKMTRSRSAPRPSTVRPLDFCTHSNRICLKSESCYAPPTVRRPVREPVGLGKWRSSPSGSKGITVGAGSSGEILGQCAGVPIRQRPTAEK